MSDREALLARCKLGDIEAQELYEQDSIRRGLLSSPEPHPIVTLGEVLQESAQRNFDSLLAYALEQGTRSSYDITIFTFVNSVAVMGGQLASTTPRSMVILDLGNVRESVEGSTFSLTIDLKSRNLSGYVDGEFVERGIPDPDPYSMTITVHTVLDGAR